jgi:general secretion pathway protein J
VTQAPSGQQGFTLVELLVALLIFGMLSAAGVALLSFSVRAQDLADARLDDVAAMRRAGALLTGDLAQAAPRIVRDEAGAVQPAFVGGAGGQGDVALALVRRGWDNPEGVSRPSLQKVEYRLAGNRLERTAYRHLDGADPMAPATVLEGVEAFGLRYRDGEGEWRERWDPTRITDLPRAVEMTVDLEEREPVRQLFLVGAGL